MKKLLIMLGVTVAICAILPTVAKADNPSILLDGSFESYVAGTNDAFTNTQLQAVEIDRRERDGLGHPVEGHLWNVKPDDKKGNWGYGGINDTKTREGLEKTYLGLMDKLGQLAECGLGGSVYTQTTDVEIEINGLLTYDRKVLKFDPAVLRKAHAEVVRRALEAPRTGR